MSVQHSTLSRVASSTYMQDSSSSSSITHAGAKQRSMTEKKARVEAASSVAVQSAHGVATALGVPLGLWSKLSHDMALRILSHVDIRDVARATAAGKELVKAVGSMKQGPLIRLNELRQTHVTLTQRDERDWNNPGFQNSVQLWHRRVEHLRIVGTSYIVGVPDLLRLNAEPAKPFFPSLISLHIECFHDLGSARWQSLLDNCPNLINVQVEAVRGFAYLDLTHTGPLRPWHTFAIATCSVTPPSVYIAVANPSTTRLAITSPRAAFPRHNTVAKWGRADVDKLAAKWKGATDKVVELQLGHIEVVVATPTSKAEWSDHDAIVLLLMEHFPNTRTIPWAGTMFVAEAATLSRVCRQWPCFTRLPPSSLELFNLYDTTKPAPSTVVEAIHDSMRQLEASGTSTFWRSWRLDQVERLIPMSTAWTDIQVSRFIGPGAEFDVKTLDWISTHAHHLEELAIEQPCKVSVAILKQLTGLPSLRRLVLGDGIVAHLKDASDVKQDTILALATQMCKHGNGTAHTEMTLLYGAMTSLSDADVQELATYWRDRLRKDVDIEILVVSNTVIQHLNGGSRQRVLSGEAGVRSITFTSYDAKQDARAFLR